MGKLDRVIRVFVLAMLTACSASAPGGSGPLGQSPQAHRRRAKAALPEVAADGRLDATGQLKPSGMRAGWLEVPSGFVEQPGSTSHLRLYIARGMPYAKAREFLQARLAPERTEFPVHGISFRDALPTYTQLAMPPLNVLLVETDHNKGEVRLLIEDLAPPEGKPLPVDSAAQALARDRNRIE
ncbi:MAG: hypothetical protein JWN48_4103 [Myxococcaceae bacterium]|nr:hypothetical protein [Myxococcaceae bacterium]